MKIIKQPNNHVICERCNAELEFRPDDVFTAVKGMLNTRYKAIKCPCCGNIIEVYNELYKKLYNNNSNSNAQNDNNKNNDVHTTSQNNMCCERCGSTTAYHYVQPSGVFIEKGDVYTTLCFDCWKELTEAIDEAEKKRK